MASVCASVPVRIRRRAQVQRCPALIKALRTISSAACCGCTLPSTINGLLPPISSASNTSGRPPNCWCSRRPVLEEPVNSRPSIGCCARASPTSRPPCSRFSTPAGRPACCHSSAVFSAHNGVSSLGLKIRVLPASSAGTIWPLGRWPGKL